MLHRARHRPARSASHGDGRAAGARFAAAVAAVAAALGVTLAAAPRPAAAADTEQQRASLVGIGGVHVHMMLNGEELESNELVESRLRPEVEARLRAAGLNVLSVEESRSEPGVPWLFVTLGVQKATDTKAYAWSIRVELEQRACLERDPAQCRSWPTWSTGRFGSVTRRRVRTLDEDMAVVVDEFAAAWRTANGR